MHADAKELFAIDENLRREADEMLARSGIGPILSEAGYKAVGSYVMHTMTWRDLDFERQEEPDWEKHWEVGTRLAKTGWCWRLQCVDHKRASIEDLPKGYYWGIRVSDVKKVGGISFDDDSLWKFDLWTATIYQANAKKRDLWMQLLTEEARAEIIALKKALWNVPEYRKTLLSIHIYEAVLQEDVRGVEAFMEWWRGRYKQDE